MLKRRAARTPRARRLSEPVFRLVYCSKSAMSGALETMRGEIDDILLSARRTNARLTVTGALLFSEDGFARVLEGARATVESLFEIIARDRRHHDVTILMFLPVERRNFPAWSMAYVGTIKDDRVSFAALTMTPGDGAETVLELLTTLAGREAAV